MGVNYGPKAGNLAVPDFKKGTDTATAAVALGAIDPEFFKESDFEIDCDGCTACCKGEDGPIINDDEYLDYYCHKDDKGNMRLDQVDGHCVYLGEAGCSIHGQLGLPLEELGQEDRGTPPWPPRICRDFDCRSVIIKFNDRGLDHLVNSGQLPLDVVIQGRAKLKGFNDMINVRAMSAGVDLSALLMKPGEEEPPDAHDTA